MNKYDLRLATISDLLDMQRVITVAMTQYAKDSSIPTILDALVETEDDLKNYVLNDYFILAFHGNSLVGTLRISSDEDNKSTSYISRFAVLPSVQNRGVGNALFVQAENYLKSKNCKTVLLHTALTNTPLVRFYTRRNFELIETKTDKGYPRGTFVKHYA